MLNYRQLHYFWAVARAGSIVRAAERLHLTPQTISGQIGELESNLGTELFRRRGRRLELTPAGKLALSHADEIFQLGAELEGQLRNRSVGAELLLRVGLADVIPKSVAYRLLAPAMALPDPVRLICQEDKLEPLFAELAIHKLDLVIADRPLGTDVGVRGFNHRLCRCAIDLYAAPELAARYRAGFPRTLAGAPLLIPGAAATMRGALLRWCAERRIDTRVVGEFDDMALMNAFGADGAGLFPAPAEIAAELHRQLGVEVVGRLAGVEVRYFAISVERRLTHPAVLAITREAKRALFAKGAAAD
jgi:LysR family transcriptional activator of nhaA